MPIRPVISGAILLVQRTRIELLDGRCRAMRRAPYQRYQRRRPEKTLWYRIVQTNLETWLELATGECGEARPAHVEQTFRRYLECGILAHGFARALLRRVPARFSDRVLLSHGDFLRPQAPWCVPLLKPAAYARNYRASGRSHFPAATGAPMGARRAQTAALLPSARGGEVNGRFASASQHSLPTAQNTSLAYFSISMPVN